MVRIALPDKAIKLYPATSKFVGLMV